MRLEEAAVRSSTQGCCEPSSIESPNRRDVLACGLVATLYAMDTFAEPATRRADLPAAVAGVSIPRSHLSIKVAQFSRSVCPDYLFNHCMRTFLFGALYLQSKNLTFDVDTAFTAAALHDIGLLPRFASSDASFEIDGANAAERFMRESGEPEAAAQIAWHAVEMHDGKWALTSRQGPEAMLVAVGAASDVDGPKADVDVRRTQEIVSAFPRLQFKSRFTALLIDHCKRKPTSQRATWLEGLCREQVPSAWTDTTEREIASAKFAE